MDESVAPGCHRVQPLADDRDGVGSCDWWEDERVSVLTEHRSEPGDDVPPSGNTRVAVVPPITASDMVAPREGETVVLGPEVEQSADATEASAEPTVTHRRPEQLRSDFGAHFEAHYQRLVAQLYAITLNPAEAHDVVREAYSRAWRRWTEVGSSADPTGWVRRVAVRSTMRSWRRTAARLGLRGGRTLVEGGEPRTRAILTALSRLRDTERRAVVLVDMAGVPVVEVASLEQVPPGTVAARLSRARRVVGDALAEFGPIPFRPDGEVGW
jgi:DNA-directed RNA polymerase specialized sigma24 family protein